MFIQQSKLYSYFCSLDKIFLYKIFYTSSLLPILHILIPSNSCYNRCNTQFITYIRSHTQYPLTIAPVTVSHTCRLLPLRNWDRAVAFVDSSNVNFLKLFFNCLILYNTFYIVYTFLCVTFMYLYVSPKYLPLMSFNLM